MARPFRFNKEASFEFGKNGLWNQQLDESCELFGAEVVYIKTEHYQPDEVFGEYLGNVLRNGTTIFLLCDQFEDDFQNEDTALNSKFGFQLTFAEATFWASQNYFEKHGITPEQTDLVYYKNVDKIFEVNKTTLTNDFKIKLDCSLYDYDNISIDEATIDEPAVTELEFINDEELNKITTPQETQTTNDNIRSSRKNNLF